MIVRASFICCTGIFVSRFEGGGYHADSDGNGLLQASTWGILLRMKETAVRAVMTMMLVEPLPVARPIPPEVHKPVRRLRSQCVEAKTSHSRLSTLDPRFHHISFRVVVSGGFDLCLSDG